MDKMDYAPIDNRFASPARQAAKALGVKIHDKPMLEAGAMYGRLRWYAEAFVTAADRILVVSADDLGLSAAVVDDFERPMKDRMERATMVALCDLTGVRNADDLVEARRDLAEIARFTA